MRCIMNLKTRCQPESYSLIVILGILWMLIDNTVFVTVAKPFHYAKITAATSVQCIYCKSEILVWNLMSLISQHSSCDFQLCPNALVCLQDYVQLVPGILLAKHSAIINRATDRRGVLLKARVYYLTVSVTDWG